MDASVDRQTHTIDGNPSAVARNIKPLSTISNSFLSTIVGCKSLEKLKKYKMPKRKCSFDDLGHDRIIFHRWWKSEFGGEEPRDQTTHMFYDQDTEK
jgi:hypothetical protein